MATLKGGVWIYIGLTIFLHLHDLVTFVNAGDPPSFIETPPPSKIARQGQSLLLKCRATGRPRPFITWRKDGHLVKDGKNGILLSRGDLAVTSLTTSHRGKYTCLAQSVEGQIRSTTVVRVEAPPEFLERPSDRTTQEGKDVMFDCSATGYPNDMRYRWTYNGEAVEASEHLRGRFSVLPSGSLIIYNIKTKDRGNVTCTVDNGFGLSPTASAALYVQFRARVLNMPAIVYAGLGLKAVLRCPSEAEPPVNNVVWKKDARRISTLQNPRLALDGQGSLIIESAMIEDAGIYTCTPYNIQGTLGESTGTDLRIREPPYFTLKPSGMYEAELGKILTIPCKGDGDPPPAVNWRKVLENGDSVQYKVQFGNLIIKQVTKEIHGTWQCVLTNSVAEVAQNVEIYVKYTIPHKVKNVTARARSHTSIQVSWTAGYDGGYPQTFIVWYRQAGKTDPSWQTFHVVGSDTVAVLEDLLPDTAYELAVLPENKLRSGPFSDTVTVRTRAARPLVETTMPLLPPPQALFSSTTDAGLVQLSWRKPEMYQPNDGDSRGRIDVAPPLSKRLKILGFLVEYRWTGTAEEEFIDRSKRTVRSRRKRSAKIPKMDEWVTLTKTYENKTTVVVQPDQLYRDLMYEFRVLTVSKTDYSPPSNPVSFSTKGLNAYPCYTGTLGAKAAIDHPMIVGILAAVILMIILVGLAIFCFCKKRRRRKKGGAAANQEEVENGPPAGRSKPAVNGKVIANKQPIVVDLTDGGSGGYGTMSKKEYDTPCSDDESKTPFIRNNNFGESDKAFAAFMERHHNRADVDSRKETLSSDRSSVRLRRETAARVLLAQYKRRSLTDHTYHRVRRDLPLRGGTRSASTSPDRSHDARNDDLNITAPAVLAGPKGRKRIRLYSRPIDDAGSSQQRRMIVIKRKSQKSSSSDQLKANSTGAPPSDSSESPVFGVVGTINHPGNGLVGAVPKTSSPIRKHGRSPFRERRTRHRSPFEDDVFSGHDVLNSKDDDFIVRSPDNGRPSWNSANHDPRFSSSPNDNSSPDVSPNRVVARRTVEYDPKVDPVVSPRPYSGSPTRRWNKSNSLTHEQQRFLKPIRSRSESNRNFHPNAKYVNLRDSTRSPYDMVPHPQHYQNPGYQMCLHGPTRNRYSYAQHQHILPVMHQSGNYHPSPPVHNASRSRASYSFGHRQPFALFTPSTVYDRPPTRPEFHSSTSASHSTHPSSSDPRSSQPTCEIDCSNSDIEVRFVKDANGNGYIPVMSRDRVDVVELGNIAPISQSPSTVTTANAASTATPSSGNSALDLRYNLRNMSTSEAGKNAGPRKITGKPPSPTKRLTPIVKHPQGHGISSPATVAEQSKPRPRHFLSPPGSKSSSPLRHVKLKSDDGSDVPPMSPPLAAIGSSDYGSQDTSNSSTSPMASNANSQNATSPLHLRFPGLAQDRPPRRDNSSVEDNYEWDSEIAMESEILEALRHFGTLKKSGPVSDELLDELNKITNDTKNLPQRQRPQSTDALVRDEEEKTEEREDPEPASQGPNYSKESMARRCAALRAEFLHYQQLQQLDEDGVT